MLAERLVRIVSEYGEAASVSTVRDADRRLKTSHDWTGALVDVCLPDGSGLQVARAVRSDLRVPCLVTTGALTPEAVNEVYRLDATLLAKPFAVDSLRAFLSSTVAAGPNGRLESTLEAWRTQYSLTTAERDVVERAAWGAAPDVIAWERGACILTVRKQIASILVKTGEESFSLLVHRLLREAMGLEGRQEPARAQRPPPSARCFAAGEESSLSSAK